ncbi:PREDICTED: programmed cell death 1 ligand 1 isoform X2 [Propithecus coquereli]|uniref:programmed cell death 1 ligand 1 isoform X2 n=1 Tax=Propithecus coquereli TaxID=379532 RepID=UPI00063F4043|nr:PREDICTED: programmed cell death 1 ligand 1 isoform X2 [Propithecus coquereli]
MFGLHSGVSSHCTTWSAKHSPASQGHSRKMKIFNVFTFTAYWHLLNAFTITVPKDLYVVEYGSNVTIECRFPVEKQLDLISLVVYWEMDNKNIIQFVRGEEDLKVQDSSYRDRARLLKDQLFLGSAALEITDVKLRDAGVYRCMISYGGADYKRITLKVNAPYRKINQRISMDPATSEHELTCQAEGYPKAEVIWTSNDHQVLRGQTTITSSNREEQLFNVTSTLRVNTSANEIFYCTFRRLNLEENNTAELIIPEPPTVLPQDERTHLVILGAVPLFLGVALTILFCLRKQVRIMDVEKCGIRDTNPKQQNDTQFEET